MFEQRSTIAALVAACMVTAFAAGSFAQQAAAPAVLVQAAEQAPIADQFEFVGRAAAVDKVELRDWAASRLVGTPDEIVAQLRDWEALGVEQVVSNFAGVPFSVFEDEQLELAAELVLPRL